MKQFAQQKSKSFSYFRLLVLVVFSIGCVSCEWFSANQELEKKVVSIENQKPLVVATSGMIADIVRAVAGVTLEDSPENKLQVVQLIAHGVDPHLYRPGRDDIIKLLGADVVFYNGLKLEGRMAEVLESGKIKKKSYAIASLLELDLLDDEEEGKGHYDPHIWMDVSVWKRAVRPVSDILSRKFPEYADVFSLQAEHYEQELQRIHEAGKALLQQLPEERRNLVTSHDAFRYFGRTYGLEVYGVQGFSTDSEAGVRRLNEIVSLVIEKNIPAVFFEAGVSPRLLGSIIEGVAAQGKKLEKGGVLYTDSMGARGTEQGTYAGMMKHNFTTIHRALSHE